MTFFEIHHSGYLITDDPARLDAGVIHHYLSNESYWAKGVSRDLVDRSLSHSLCLGVYAASGEQVGLARIITDRATFAWLCDVFVLDAHRGHGLGKALVHAVISHPHLRSVRRIGLGTANAHGLYSQFGFTPLAEPERQMEKRSITSYLATGGQT